MVTETDQPAAKKVKNQQQQPMLDSDESASTVATLVSTTATTEGQITVIKLNEGDLLRKFFEKSPTTPNQKTLGVDVKFIRRTGTGDMLVELGSNTDKAGAFYETVKSVLGTKAVVCRIEPMCTNKIRDLDYLTHTKEVEDGVTSM